MKLIHYIELIEQSPTIWRLQYFDIPDTGQPLLFLHDLAINYGPRFYLLVDVSAPFERSFIKACYEVHQL